MEAAATEKDPAASESEPGVGEAVPRSEPADEAEGRREAAVEAYARDHEGLDEGNEQDALDFLLAPKPPRFYGVTVQYDTEAGLLPLTFVVRGIDGRKIDAIEQEHVNDATGKIDRFSADARIVAEAMRAFETPKRTVSPTSDAFLMVRRPVQVEEGEEPRFEQHRLASPADAILARFATQLGLISGVARRVREISGFDPERVGVAHRRLVTAAGNS